MAAIIFLAIVAGVIVAIVSIYNGLVSSRNRFKNAFAQIDVQLKRRYDLIPNLVETAKGYIKHERETLEAVIKARNQAMAAAQAASANPGNPAAMQGLGQAEGALTGVLGRMFALAGYASGCWRIMAACTAVSSARAASRVAPGARRPKSSVMR